MYRSKEPSVKVTLTGRENLTIDSHRPSDEYWKYENKESGKFLEVNTNKLTFDQDVLTSDQDLPRPGLKKDPNKVESSKNEVCQKLSTLKWNVITE